MASASPGDDGSAPATARLTPIRPEYIDNTKVAQRSLPRMMQL